MGAKRMVSDTSAGINIDSGNMPLIAAVLIGSAAFVALSIFSVCFVVRKRYLSNGQRRQKAQLKQFLLPKDTKPVIGFKTAAGPGGLKKSPSPVQSPENPEREWMIRASINQDGSGFIIPKSISYTSTSSSSGGGCGLGELSSRKSSSNLSSSTSFYGNQQFSAAKVPLHSKGTEEELTPLMGAGGGVVGSESSSKNATTATPDQRIVDESFKYDPSRKATVDFTLKYNFDKNTLTVSILGATNLMPKKLLPGYLALAQNSAHLSDSQSSPNEPESTLDPYIKLQLLPEKQHKVKTKVIRNTLNPVYDEEFVFYGLGYNQLQSTTLHFVAVTFDRYSRDEIIGEVVCPLHSVDLSQSEKSVDVIMELVNRASKFENALNRGDVLVSLSYQPATSKITVVVLKAKNLPKFDITGFADPYVKVYMLYNGQKIAKKKTHVKKRTLAPVFNESFTFDLPNTSGADPSAVLSILEAISFEFLVMDWDRVTKNEVMGRADVGSRSKTTIGRQHWDEMRKSPRKQIAEWHRLRP